MATTITELLAMDDAALGAKLGFTDKTKIFRADLERASKLTDEAKKIVEKELTQMFTPHIYSGDLTYTIDRAERKVKNKDCDGPAQLVSTAGDCGCD